MLTLYITRHGETEWNIQNRMQGWGDSELTENGIGNAVSLGGRLKEVKFKAIYSSPSKRTRVTAELIRGIKNIPIVYDEKLKEINMGEWEGKTKSYIIDHYPNEYHLFWNAPHLYHSDNGENFIDLQIRVLKAIDTIKEQNTSGNILIVTHSVVIKMILALFKNTPLEKLWDPPFIHDTSLTVIEMSGNGNRIVLEGDISHRKAVIQKEKVITND
ncbi:histidine phosphatase family protein [Heyndrickxia sp. NPDC080065]|uniref:histidine phosphatase family protein n=1 Tax=Heyndrickxia sp. NPDC080065 TaxID=3390568 RepID=UPI003D03AFDC